MLLVKFRKRGSWAPFQVSPAGLLCVQAQREAPRKVAFKAEEA